MKSKTKYKVSRQKLMEEADKARARVSKYSSEKRRLLEESARRRIYEGWMTRQHEQQDY